MEMNGLSVAMPVSLLPDLVAEQNLSKSRACRSMTPFFDSTPQASTLPFLPWSCPLPTMDSSGKYAYALGLQLSGVGPPHPFSSSPAPAPPPRVVHRVRYPPSASDPLTRL